MKLSFVILSYRRPELLRRCLESLDRCGMAGDCDAWVGLNGRDPSHEPLLRELPSRYPWLHLVELSRASRGGARNRLAELARGDALFFLDDDTVVPEGFVRRALEKFERNPDCPVIGGPNLGPADAAPFERAVDRFFNLPVAAGPMRIRFVRKGKDRVLPGWCFQLSNLGIRRKVFARHGLGFPDRCVSAEENLLLFRVERKIGPALYCPDLHVFHRRRAQARSFCRQIFLSGRGRMQITRQAPRSLQPIVLAPAAGLLYLFALPFLPHSVAALAPAALYAAACAAGTLVMIFVDRDPRGALWLPPVMALGHLSYAAGLFAGLIPL